MRTAHEFRIHQCWDIAAALTYYVVLMACPALLAALAFLGLFGSAEDVATGALHVVRDLGGEGVAQALAEPIDQLLGASRAGLALVTGLALTLWTASAYLGTFGRGMNRILGVEEGRPFWRSRPAMIATAAVLVLLGALIAFGLLVSGAVATAVLHAMGFDEELARVWDVAKLPVIAVLAGLMLAVLYWAAPNVRRPQLRWVSTGAAIALAIWITTTALFGVYVWNVSHYDRVYGVLGGVVAFLVWIWLSNTAILVGGVLDAELERARQLRAGVPAHERLELELRDDRLIRLNRRQRESDVRASAAMRPAAAADEP
ncbi:YihY/virulence factor BrkB family protein [Agromyces aurantiacus]|uniref:YihY/virulence factor BrkB family protein n=1 Tax=Agromyces aurantiacus TaxID=165814 RepID=A0ABV9R0U8_9MICO